MSHSATSTAAEARVTIPSGEPPPTARSRLPMASMSIGSLPMTSSAMALTHSWRDLRMTSLTKPAYPIPSMPSSVRRVSATKGATLAPPTGGPGSRGTTTALVS